MIKLADIHKVCYVILMHLIYSRHFNTGMLIICIFFGTKYLLKLS